MNKSKIFYDSKIDALWIMIKDGQEEDSREVAPNINVELDAKGELIGVEILNASKVLGVKPKVKEKLLENVSS